jgi:hypothetical protein
MRPLHRLAETLFMFIIGGERDQSVPTGFSGIWYSVNI